MGLDRVANSPPESKINWPQRFCEINHWWKCQAKNKDGVEKKETKRIVSIWHWFQDAHFFTFWHLWTLWNWHISYAILQPLACRHQRDLAVTACMCKLAHRHCSCQHFSGIVCVVGSTCARFNCRVKCLQKDYTMIQYWKENLQCLQKGRKTKQQGINLILMKAQGCCHEKEVIEWLISLEIKESIKIFLKGEFPALQWLGLCTLIVKGPGSIFGRGTKS